MTVSEDAPAKVNLALHVTGRRDDGYHLLDSFVVFAGIGDRVDAGPAAAMRLEILGPEAATIPTDATNSVLRAADLIDVPARLRLHKELPSAAGLGGGSADAAATLRALARISGRALPDGLVLGADVPVCLRGEPARMSGIGEQLEPVPPLPPAWLVLVNPRVLVATADVFRALARRENAPLPERWPAWPDTPALAGWLAGQRNDLEAPACAATPVIADVIAALRAEEECLLARMSGSGATCFGLFGDRRGAEAAAAAIGVAQPQWWVRAAPVLAAQSQVTRATT